MTHLAQAPRFDRAQVAVHASAALVVALIAAAYANALAVPFLFDDLATIAENPSLHSLGTVLLPPTTGMPVTGRPVANVFFALDHALHGMNPRGYHFTNIALHAAAALALLGVVRRSLELLRWSPAGARIAALCVSTLWALHPLQTASVTYLSQRTEILAALAALLALLAFLRSLGSRHYRSWLVVSVLFCLVAMGSKETAVGLPLLLLLHDRTLVAGSFEAAWQARKGYFVGLAATWILLLALVLASPDRGGSAGASEAVSWWNYLLTQAGAIVRYLRLAFWPEGLVFDYGTPVVASLGESWAEVLLVLLLAGATILTLRRNSSAGIAGAWLFAWLAPSSSVVPVITQTIAEHRFYLPLAAVLSLLIAPLFRLSLRAGIVISIVLAATLLWVTHARNEVYRSQIALWSDTVEKVPANARAHYNLGRALFLAGEVPAAHRALEGAIRLRPKYARALEALGQVLEREGNPDAALASYDRALELEPRFPAARVNRGGLHARAGRLEAAIADFRAAVAAEPGAVDARLNLAETLLRAARPAAAIDEFTRLLQLPRVTDELRRRARAGLAQAHNARALALARTGRWAESAAGFEAALEADPGFARAHANLGNVRLQQGRVRDAITQYERARQLSPELPGIAENLAIARQALEDERK